ncbi:hypothetical protein T4E_12116 [Trichinella pseudospiralis]|uniref:Uncharacterized protein n=1 Tax=Trichinella pseudospiralis TaxID=6337 RepID=A0A0V0XQL9_TRIPS|nr:hypothetical protein T4E_12116 [Trichinella pseudospiralis]
MYLIRYAICDLQVHFQVRGPGQVHKSFFYAQYNRNREMGPVCLSSLSAAAILPLRDSFLNSWPKACCST